MLSKIKKLFSNNSGKEEKLIHVRFIDSETGYEFANSDMPASLLPESFEAHTNMSIQGHNWEVIEARPMTSSEFVTSGNLILFLRKVQIKSMPPGDILYSIPTLCNEIPGISEGTSKLGKQVLEIHEDDWRQIEFVPMELEEAVNIDMAKIEYIYKESSKKLDSYTAFTDVYVRERLQQPIQQNEISYIELIECFNNKEIMDGIAYEGIAGVVKNGFAIKVGLGLYLYGLEKDGLVNIFGLKLIDKLEIKADEIEEINQLMMKFKLLLVDWCSLVKLSANNDTIEDYFKR